jgi:hypothetical protein
LKGSICSRATGAKGRESPTACLNRDENDIGRTETERERVFLRGNVDVMRPGAFWGEVDLQLQASAHLDDERACGEGGLLPPRVYSVDVAEGRALPTSILALAMVAARTVLDEDVQPISRIRLQDEAAPPKRAEAQGSTEAWMGREVDLEVYADRAFENDLVRRRQRRVRRARHLGSVRAWGRQRRRCR